jgi:hypothetical protein
VHICLFLAYSNFVTSFSLLTPKEILLLKIQNSSMCSRTTYISAVLFCGTLGAHIWAYKYFVTSRDYVFSSVWINFLSIEEYISTVKYLLMYLLRASYAFKSILAEKFKEHSTSCHAFSLVCCTVHAGFWRKSAFLRVKFRCSYITVAQVLTVIWRGKCYRNIILEPSIRLLEWGLNSLKCLLAKQLFPETRKLWNQVLLSQLGREMS